MSEDNSVSIELKVTDNASTSIGEITNKAQQANEQLSSLQRTLNAIAAIELRFKTLDVDPVKDITNKLNTGIKDLEKPIKLSADVQALKGIETAISNLSSKIESLGKGFTTSMVEAAKQTTIEMKRSSEESTAMLKSQLKIQETEAAASAKIRVATEIAAVKEVAKARKEVNQESTTVKYAESTNLLTAQLQFETKVREDFNKYRITNAEATERNVNDILRDSNAKQLQEYLSFYEKLNSISKKPLTVAGSGNFESLVTATKFANLERITTTINTNKQIETEFANHVAIMNKNASQLETGKAASSVFSIASDLQKQYEIQSEVRKRNAAEEVALFDKVRTYKNTSLDTDTSTYKKRAEELASVFSSVKFAPKIDPKSQEQFDTIIDRINKLRELKESVLQNLKAVDTAYENHKNKAVQANLEIKAAEEARAKATQSAVNYAVFWKNELDALDARNAKLKETLALEQKLIEARLLNKPSVSLLDRSQLQGGVSGNYQIGTKQAADNLIYSNTAISASTSLLAEKLKYLDTIANHNESQIPKITSSLSKLVEAENKVKEQIHAVNQAVLSDQRETAEKEAAILQKRIDKLVADSEKLKLLSRSPAKVDMIAGMSSSGMIASDSASSKAQIRRDELEQMRLTAQWLEQQAVQRYDEAHAQKTQQTTSVVNELSNSLNKLQQTLMMVGVAMSGRQIMEYADQWTHFTNAVGIATEKTGNAAGMQERLFKLAQDNRAPLESITSIYLRMSRAAETLNMTQGQTVQMIDTVTKSLAIMGTSPSQVRGGLLQLEQALGGVTVRGQEFKSILDSMPNVMNQVAKHYLEAEKAIKLNEAALRGASEAEMNEIKAMDTRALSISQLRNMMYAGKISSEAFAQAIILGQTEIDATFAKTHKTFAQAFSYMENAFIKWIGQINEGTKGSDLFYQSMVKLGDNLTNIAKSMEILAATFVTFKVSSALAVIEISKLEKALESTLLFISNINPYVKAATAIVALGTAFYEFKDDIKVDSDYAATWGDVLDHITNHLGESISNWMSDLKGFKDWLSSEFPKTSSVVKSVYDLGQSNQDAITSGIKSAGSIAYDISPMSMFEGFARIVSKEIEQNAFIKKSQYDVTKPFATRESSLIETAIIPALSNIQNTVSNRGFATREQTQGAGLGASITPFLESTIDKTTDEGLALFNKLEKAQQFNKDLKASFEGQAKEAETVLKRQLEIAKQGLENSEIEKAYYSEMRSMYSDAKQNSKEFVKGLKDEYEYADRLKQLQPELAAGIRKLVEERYKQNEANKEGDKLSKQLEDTLSSVMSKVEADASWASNFDEKINKQLEAESIKNPAKLSVTIDKEDTIKRLNELNPLFEKYASGNVSAQLLRAVAAQESRGIPTAYNKRSGAAGLMQFIPATAEEYGITDRFNSEQSVRAANKYFNALLKMFDGDMAKALAGYNWGQGNVQKAVAKAGKNWLSLAPKETQDYIPSVTGRLSDVKQTEELTVLQSKQLELKKALSDREEALAIAQQHKVAGATKEYELDVLRINTTQERVEKIKAELGYADQQYVKAKELEQARRTANVKDFEDFEKRIKYQRDSAAEYEDIMNRINEISNAQLVVKDKGGFALPDLDKIIKDSLSAQDAIAANKNNLIAQLSDLKEAYSSIGKESEMREIIEARVIELTKELSALDKEDSQINKEKNQAANLYAATLTASKSVTEDLVQGNEDLLALLTTSTLELEKQKAIKTAGATGIDAQNIRDLIDTRENLKGLVSVKNTVVESFQSGFSTMFQDMLLKGTSATDALANMFNNMLARITASIMDFIAQGLVQKMFSGMSGGIFDGLGGTLTALTAAVAVGTYMGLQKSGTSIPTTTSQASKYPNGIPVDASTMLATDKAIGDMVFLQSSKYAATFNESLKNTMGAAFTVVRMNTAAIGAKIAEYFPNLVNSVNSLSSTVTNSLGTIFETGKTLINQATNWVSSTVTSASNTISNVGTNAVDKLGNAISNAITPNLTNVTTTGASSTATGASQGSSMLGNTVTVIGYAAAVLSTGYQLYSVWSDKNMKTMDKIVETGYALSDGMLAIGLMNMWNPAGWGLMIASAVTNVVSAIGSIISDGFNARNITRLLFGVFGGLIQPLFEKQKMYDVNLSSGKKNKDRFADITEVSDKFYRNPDWKGRAGQWDTNMGFLHYGRTQGLDYKLTPEEIKYAKTLADLVQSVGNVINKIDIQKGLESDTTLSKFRAGKAIRTRTDAEEFDAAKSAKTLFGKIFTKLGEVDTETAKVVSGWAKVFMKAFPTEYATSVVSLLVKDSSTGSLLEGLSKLPVEYIEYVGSKVKTLVTEGKSQADIMKDVSESLGLIANSTSILGMFNDTLIKFNIVTEGNHAAVINFLKSFDKMEMSLQDTATVGNNLISLIDTVFKSITNYVGVELTQMREKAMTDAIADMNAVVAKNKLTGSQAAPVLLSAINLADVAASMGLKQSSEAGKIDFSAISQIIIDSAVSEAAKTDLRKPLDEAERNLIKAQQSKKGIKSAKEEVETATSKYNQDLIALLKKAGADTLNNMLFAQNTFMASTNKMISSMVTSDFIANANKFVEAIGGIDKAVAMTDRNMKAALGDKGFLSWKVEATGKASDLALAKIGQSKDTIKDAYLNNPLDVQLATTYSLLLDNVDAQKAYNESLREVEQSALKVSQLITDGKLTSSAVSRRLGTDYELSKMTVGSDEYNAKLAEITANNLANYLKELDSMTGTKDIIGLSTQERRTYDLNKQIANLVNTFDDGTAEGKKFTDQLINMANAINQANIAAEYQADLDKVNYDIQIAMADEQNRKLIEREKARNDIINKFGDATVQTANGIVSVADTLIERTNQLNKIQDIKQSQSIIDTLMSGYVSLLPADSAEGQAARLEASRQKYAAQYGDMEIGGKSVVDMFMELEKATMQQQASSTSTSSKSDTFGSDLKSMLYDAKLLVTEDYLKKEVEFGQQRADIIEKYNDETITTLEGTVKKADVLISVLDTKNKLASYQEFKLDLEEAIYQKRYAMASDDAKKVLELERKKQEIIKKYGNETIDGLAGGVKKADTLIKLLVSSINNTDFTQAKQNLADFRRSIAEWVIGLRTTSLGSTKSQLDTAQAKFDFLSSMYKAGAKEGFSYDTSGIQDPTVKANIEKYISQIEAANKGKEPKDILKMIESNITGNADQLIGAIKNFYGSSKEGNDLIEKVISQVEGMSGYIADSNLLLVDALDGNRESLDTLTSSVNTVEGALGEAITASQKALEGIKNSTLSAEFKQSAIDSLSKAIAAAMAIGVSNLSIETKNLAAENLVKTTTAVLAVSAELTLTDAEKLKFLSKLDTAMSDYTAMIKTQIENPDFTEADKLIGMFLVNANRKLNEIIQLIDVSSILEDALTAESGSASIILSDFIKDMRSEINNPNLNKLTIDTSSINENGVVRISSGKFGTWFEGLMGDTGKKSGDELAIALVNKADDFIKIGDLFGFLIKDNLEKHLKEIAELGTQYGNEMVTKLKTEIDKLSGYAVPALDTSAAINSITGITTAAQAALAALQAIGAQQAAELAAQQATLTQIQQTQNAINTANSTTVTDTATVTDNVSTVVDAVTTVTDAVSTVTDKVAEVTKTAEEWFNMPTTSTGLNGLTLGTQTTSTPSIPTIDTSNIVATVVPTSTTVTNQITVSPGATLMLASDSTVSQHSAFVGATYQAPTFAYDTIPSGGRGSRYFASGGAFTNGIVKEPTMFNMAMMGEAGSEGILPLANVGGKLGVYAANDSGNNEEELAELKKQNQILMAQNQILQAAFQELIKQNEVTNDKLDSIDSTTRKQVNG